MAVILGNPIMLGGGGGSQSELKKISTLSEGDIIKIKENGVLTDYYLAQHDYQPSLNGSGRVLFARKEAYGRHAWNSSANSTYANSSVDNFLNNDFKALFDADVRAAMGETSIPSAIGYGNSTVTTLQKSVFLLSVTEFGKSHANASVEGAAVPIADILTVANSGGVASAQWTRTPYNGGTGDVWYLSNSGNLSAYAVATTTYTIRPCFTLPNTATVNPTPNADGSYTLQLENVNLTLNNLMAGDTVRVKENGVFADYYIGQQNYQPNLNGAGRTLFVRKECYNKQAWDAGQVNAYAGSDIDIWLNGDCKGMYDSAVREAMGETTFPYTPGNGNTTVTNLQRSVFLLSGTEFGKSKAQMNVEGVAVPIANLLNPVYLDGEQTLQWTRSPNTANTYVAWVVIPDGNIVSDYYCSTLQGTRWAFTLPASFSIEQNDLGTYDLVYESDYPMGYLELTIEGGTTQPTNPKDNTIWVNTDVDLGLTYLAPNAPSNPQVGDVWVNTTNKYNSNGTNASTNLIRVNDNPYLEINVLNISQWDGSAWVTRENSAIYANGAWTTMALWFYNYGTLNEAFPLWYAGSNGTASSSPFTMTWFFNQYDQVDGAFAQLETNTSNTMYGLIAPTAPVDFSKYTTIKAKVLSVSSTQSVYFGYYPNSLQENASSLSWAAVNNYFIGTFSLAANVETEISASLSNINGVYYPMIADNKGSNPHQKPLRIFYWCMTA